MSVRGVEVVFDAARQEIRIDGLVAPAPLAAGKQRLIVFADRTGLEVFAADGLTYIPVPTNVDADERTPEVRVAGGPIRFDSLEIYELKSIWPADGGR